MDNDGKYGQICDDFWNVVDGNVVCRILGKGSAISAPTQAFFGKGDGDIILDDVQCHGNENSLFGCTHKSSHDCIQNEAAGVVCTGII